MTEPKFLKLFAVLCALSKIAKWSAALALVSFLSTALVGVDSSLAKYLVFAAGILLLFSLACVIIRVMLVLIFYSRYSLLSLVSFVIFLNVIAVCLFFSPYGLNLIAVYAICILLFIVFCNTMLYDPAFDPRYFVRRHLKSSTYGMISHISVRSGDKVSVGQTLLVLHDEKIVRVVRAACKGTVESIDVAPGQLVMKGMVLGVLRAMK